MIQSIGRAGRPLADNSHRRLKKGSRHCVKTRSGLRSGGAATSKVAGRWVAPRGRASSATLRFRPKRDAARAPMPVRLRHAAGPRAGAPSRLTHPRRAALGQGDRSSGQTPCQRDRPGLEALRRPQSEGWPGHQRRRGGRQRALNHGSDRASIAANGQAFTSGTARSFVMSGQICGQRGVSL